MQKRTRKEAEELVKGKFPNLSHHYTQVLTSIFQDVKDCYCPNCHGIGDVYKPKGTYVVSSHCICKVFLRRKELAEKLFDESNIPHMYQDADVSKWKNMGTESREQQLNQASFHTADVYSKTLQRMKDKGYGLFLCGPNGVGKTYLACAIGNAAAKCGYTIKFYTMNTIIQTQIRGWFHEDAKEIVDGISTADFLIIDDLDKIYRTKTGIETSLFDNMLRERLQRQRPCILTSNRTLSSAREDYSSSIHSMLLEQCAEIVFVGKDHRENISLDVRRDILSGD